MVDTLGLMLGIVVHPGDVQDRDGAREMLRHTRRRYPFIEVIYADRGYQGRKMAATVSKTGAWRLEIVKRNHVPRFEVLPKRWIVERSRRDGVKRAAWLGRCRRHAKDFENLDRTAVALLWLASVRLLLRRLTRACS